MANKSLEVTISADVTSLQSQSAVAKAEFNALSSTVRSLAKEYIAASEDMKSSINAQLLQQVELADQAKAHFASLQAQIAKVSGEAAESRGAFASLKEEILGVGEQAEFLTDMFTGVTGAFGKVGELVAVGFGVDWIGEQIDKVAELGESYSQLSEKTGATVSQLAGLRLAAMETGTDFDEVGNGLRSLGSKMQDAVVHPSGEAAQAFKALSVSVTDSSGQLLPVVDVFANISTAMAALQDGTAKTALAGDVLGARFGSALIPVMNQTGQGFGDLQSKAQQLGLTMSGSSVEASEQFMQAQKDAGASLMGLRDTIFGSNLPAFTALEQEFVIASQDGGLLKDAALVLDLGLKVLADTAVAVVTAITEIADAANFVGQVLGDVILVADGLAHALDGDFAFARASVKVATADIAQNWTDMLQKMKAQETLFKNTDNSLWSSPPDLTPATTMTTVADHQGTGDQPAPQLAPSASAGGRDGGVSKARDAQNQITQIAQDAAAARKAVAESEYQTQVSNWTTEVAQGKLTKTQEVQDEIAAKGQIYAVEVQEAQQEIALAPLGSEAKAKAQDDLLVLTAQHNSEMAQMNTELVEAQIAQAKEVADAQAAAAAATAQKWQQAFAPITQAFDSSLNGVLQGSQTLQQAEIKAAQSIALAYVDAAAKKVVAFAVSEAQLLAGVVANEVGMTAAVTAGNATRLAVQTTANDTGRALDAASSSAVINNDAAKAFSGAYSAVVGIPYVGPVLAPIAGATAFAAVMAYDVLSSAGGLAVPPGVNPLVQLHENETVLPADIAQPLNTFLGSSAISNSNSSTGDMNINFSPTYHGVGSDVAGAANKMGNALMNQIIDLTRNGTLRLPGR